MKNFLPALAVALLESCGGSSDPNKVLFSGEFQVESKKFAYKKVTLDRMGSYTLTITPQGGDVEARLAPGEAPPIVVYNPNEALPNMKLFSDGKEDSAVGTNDWGGHHIVVFNRGPATVKVRCKLTIVENPPKN